mgnify:CR=1 FL=1
MVVDKVGDLKNLFKLRYSQKSKPDEFIIHRRLMVPIISIVIIVYFLSSLTFKEVLGTVIFIGILTGLFVINKGFKKLKT